MAAADQLERPPWGGPLIDSMLLPWFEALASSRPGLQLLDVHTHLGLNDPDGFSMLPEELLGALRRIDARSAVFAMHEPAGYSAANDFVLEQAAASDGRMVAFCRLDPAADAAGEARRCVEAGARGLKLHPRAENFTLDAPGVREVFAFAGERGLPVIIHAGRGIPALGKHAVEYAARFPDARIILAHAGICDLSWIWRAAGEHSNLYFDTAWWSVSDLLALFMLVPPGQILHASDAPYGTPMLGALMDLLCVAELGWSDSQVKSMTGEQSARLLAGEEPLDLGPAIGVSAIEPLHPLLDRVYTFLVNAIGRMFVGESPEEPLSLALMGCEVSDDLSVAPVLRSIETLLRAGAAWLAQQPQPLQIPRNNPLTGAIVIAAAIARTPRAPLPSAL